MSKQKIIYLALSSLLVIFSLASWLSLRGLLFNQSDGYLVSLIPSIISFLFFGIIFGLLVFLFESQGLLAGALGVSMVVFFLVFGFNFAYLIVLALGFTILILSAFQVINQKQIRIKIIVSEILKPALKNFFAVAAIMISLVLYFSPSAQNLSVELKIPRSLFDAVFNSTIGALTGQSQDASSQRPDSFLSIPGLPKINLAEQDLPLSIISQEEKDNIYNEMNKQLNFFLKPYKHYLPYGFAVALFFSLIAVRFIFVWLSIWIVKLVFFIMKRTNLAVVKKEMVEKEIVQIES